MARSPILSMMYARQKMNQLKNAGGHIQNGFGTVKGISGELQKRVFDRNREFAKRAAGNEVAIERRNDLLLDRKALEKEQQRIYEKLLESMGIQGRIDTFRANRDPRIKAIAITIHSIFGPNISVREMANINKILQNNLHSKSPIILQSPALKSAIEQIRTRKAKIGGQEYGILAQASLDILRNDEIGQQILQRNNVG